MILRLPWLSPKRSQMAFDDAGRWYVVAAQQSGGSCANYDAFTNVFGAPNGWTASLSTLESIPLATAAEKHLQNSTWWIHSMFFLISSYSTVCCSIRLQISWAIYCYWISVSRNFPNVWSKRDLNPIIGLEALSIHVASFRRSWMAWRSWLFSPGIRLVRLTRGPWGTSVLNLIHRQT